MRTIIRIAATAVLVALAVWGWKDYQANKGFTPWMTGVELQKFCDAHDTTPPGGHPNFWDKGHWIDAVEGRWHDGVPQYRLRYGDSPKHCYLWWYWYFNQDQESFSRHVHEFADQGFTLLDPNSFRRPDDTRRYQGVWHKTQTKAEHQAEAAAIAAKTPATNAINLNPLPPGSMPETPAFEVVDDGIKMSFSEINKDQLGHQCSVYLHPDNTPMISPANVPSGTYVTRGNILIVNGKLFGFTQRTLEIRNQNRIVPVLGQQIDYVVVAR